MDEQKCVFNVYIVEGDDKEVVASFDDKDDAIGYAEQLHCSAEVVVIPLEDPDDNPDVAEWFEYFSDYEPYEVIWSNIIEED